MMFDSGPSGGAGASGNIVDQLAASAGGAGDSQPGNASMTAASLFDDFGDFALSG